MIAALAAVALLTTAPANLDLPPEISAPAEANTPAVRLDTPSTTSVETLPSPASGSSVSAGGRCVGWEPLLERYSPGWSIERMSRIMYRESRCQPAVRNRSGSTGLLQLMPMHCAWLDDALGEPCSVARLQDPEYNVRAAAALWARDGYRPWAL